MSQREEDPDKSCCCMCVKCCLVCCYLGCPPLPSEVVRKIAFHPTKKGRSYTLFYKDDPDREIDDIKEMENEKIGMRLHKTRVSSRATVLDLEIAVENVEPFTVTTRKNNTLLAVKYTPSTLTLTDQVLLFSQPNSSDLGQLLNPEAAILQRLGEIIGAEIFSYDYSGYGYSTGTAKEKNIYADVEAVYEAVRTRNPTKKVLQRKKKKRIFQIVLIGFSIGTAASVHMASLSPSSLSGLVLLAGFTSGLPVILKKQPTAETCCLDQFCSIKRIGDVDVPLLLIHGTNDMMIPIEHSKMLLTRAKRPVAPLWLPDVVHSTVLAHPATYRRIRHFVREEIGDQSSAE